MAEITILAGMKKKTNNHVVFKPYAMGQLQFPSDLEEFIPEKHLVRVVHETIERMDLTVLLRQYKGGGTSSYHPKMMLKILIYAYTQRIYSSRQIAKALRENVHFMWLSAHNRPDFRTINRFRGEIMKEVVEEVFRSVLDLLIDEGYIKLDHYFLDGTKIEANANRYSFVWAKSTRRYKEQLETKVRDLLEEIDRVNKEENEEYGDRDLEELGGDEPINSEKLEKTVEKINERLQRHSGAGDKTMKRAVRKIEKDFLPRLRKYEAQEDIFQGRSSYSKTDEDATFMRMKEDHMGNGQLKPAYNLQLGTENQFVVGYSLHPRPGDPGCMISHVDQLKRQVGRLPKSLVADAAYGSEENYSYLEQEGVEAYVKYSTFDQEQRKVRRRRKRLYKQPDFHYDESRDAFLCPEGRWLVFQKTRRVRSENGFLSERRIYQCESCTGCSQKENCTQAKGDRQLHVSWELNRLKEEAADRLCSEDGLILRKRRPIEAESVFGRWKHNWGFRRFLLRGQDKVKTEIGLLAIAHDLTKMARMV